MHNMQRRILSLKFIANCIQFIQHKIQPHYTTIFFLISISSIRWKQRIILCIYYNTSMRAGLRPARLAYPYFVSVRQYVPPYLRQLLWINNTHGKWNSEVATIQTNCTHEGTTYIKMSCVYGHSVDIPAFMPDHMIAGQQNNAELQS